MLKLFESSSGKKFMRLAALAFVLTAVQSCNYSAGSYDMQAEGQTHNYTPPREQDYSPLLSRVLGGGQGTELSLDDSIAVINECVRLGQSVVDFLGALPGQIYRPPVIVLGNTGCGKSTTLNWLAGCEMLNHRLQILGGKQIITTKTRANGGPKDPVTAIGHSRDRSKTFLPIPVVGDGGNVYIDCPGFRDSRGAAINISNLINIKNLIKAIPAAKIILLVDYPSIAGSRSASTTQMIDLLIAFFGGEEGLLQHKESISLGITKINSHNNEGLDTLSRLLRFLTAENLMTEQGLNEQNINEERVEIELDFADLNLEDAAEDADQEPVQCNEQLNSSNAFRHFRNRVFTFDPLARNIGGGFTLEQMYTYIEERIQPLSTSHLHLRTALSPEDTIELHNIGQKILDRIKTTVRLRQGQDYIPDNLVEFREVSTQLLSVEKLRIIESPKIDEIVLAIYALINSRLLVLKEQCKEKCHLFQFPVSDILFQALSTAVGYFDITAYPQRVRIVEGVDLPQLQIHCSTIKTNKQAQDIRMSTLESSNTSLQNSFAASQQNANAQLASLNSQITSLNNRLSTEAQQREAHVREMKVIKDNAERNSKQQVNNAYRESIISGLRILFNKANSQAKGSKLAQDIRRTLDYVSDVSDVDFCEVRCDGNMEYYDIEVSKVGNTGIGANSVIYNNTKRSLFGVGSSLSLFNDDLVFSYGNVSKSNSGFLFGGISSRVLPGSLKF